MYFSVEMWGPLRGPLKVMVTVCPATARFSIRQSLSAIRSTCFLCSYPITKGSLDCGPTHLQLCRRSASALSRLFQPLTRQANVVRSALALYEACVHGVDYDSIYRTCQMPDTLQSWFLVNSLHVWFCLVRLKPEGQNGRLVYRQLVDAMWADVRQRVKAMGINSPTDTRKGIDQLSQQFFGLIVAFDEGLLSHDTVLAAALWWNLFGEKRKLEPLAVAQMVSYVRAQVKHLDTVTSSELFSDQPVMFLPFQQCVVPSQL